MGNWYDPATEGSSTPIDSGGGRITKTIWDALVAYLRGHKNEHITGGVDVIPNATVSKTGLCPVLSGTGTEYLDGTGNFTDPGITKVSSVSGTAPIVSSGGLTPAISITAATTGAPGSMSAADKTKLDGIETLADVTDVTNVNAAGAVMEADYNAYTVLAADTNDTPLPLTVNASTVVGRKSTGGIVALTKAELLTVLNVEDGADVTDAANVNTAGAVMESDYEANSVLAATLDNTPVPITIAEQRIIGRKTGGNIIGLTAAEIRTIINVSDGANAYAHPNHTGDVTSVADGAATIATAAVTLAKMADLAQDKIIGRSTASTGVPEVITCTAAGRALLDDADIAAQRTTLGLGTMAQETAANYILKTLVDGKGDLIVGTADNTVARLAIGSDGQVLTAQSDGSAAWENSSLTGAVTAVSGSAPIVSSGGTTPAISISAATTGAAGSMSATDKTKLDAIATGANNYVHPHHSGDVTSVNDGATTIAAGAVSLAKMANIATDKLIGRSTAGTGVPEAITCTAAGRAILDDADAATQRTTLGLSTMATEDKTAYVDKALYDANTILAADTDNTPAAVTVAEQRVVGRITGGNIKGMTAAEIRTLINVADGAAAGTVTEVTATLPVSVSSGTSTPNITIATATTGASGSMSASDKTKLDGIETAADVTDATNVAAAGAVMGTLLTAKGSIIRATAASTPAELTVGTDGQVLTAQSDGSVAWEDIPGGVSGVINVLAASPISSSGGNQPIVSLNDGGVSLGKMANLPESTVIGRTAGSGTGAPVALTKTQLLALLNVQDGATAGSGTVTSVSGTSPITVTTGTTTPVIGIDSATTSSAGAMSADDKKKLDNRPITLTAYSAIQPDTFSAELEQTEMATNAFPLPRAIFRRMVGAEDMRDIDRLCWMTPLNGSYGAGTFRFEVFFTHAASTNRTTVWNLYGYRFNPNTAMTTILPKLATTSFTSAWDNAYAGSVTSMSSEFSVTGTGNLIFWELRLGTISDGDVVGSGDVDTTAAKFVAANIYPT